MINLPDDIRKKIEVKMIWLTHTYSDKVQEEAIDCVVSLLEEIIGQKIQPYLDVSDTRLIIELINETLRNNSEVSNVIALSACQRFNGLKERLEAFGGSNERK